MRKPLVSGLGLNTFETLELSSAPKQASPPLTLAALAAYLVKEYNFIENNRVSTSLGSNAIVVPY
jgi:hypothetical protein